MDKEKKKKRSVQPVAATDDSPVKLKTPLRPSSPSSSNRSNRKTWSPSDFATASGEDFQALLEVEAAKGTFILIIFPLIML
jgi:hypothetical protein